MNDDMGDLTYVPVERNQTGFVVSKEWIKYDLPFPTKAEFEKTTARSTHEKITDQVIVNNVLVDAEIYIFESKNEAPIAVVKSSDLGERMKEQKNYELSRYYSDLLEEVSCTEYVLPEQKNWIDAIFVTPTFKFTNSKTTIHCTLDQLQSEPRILIIGPAGAGKTTVLRHWTRSLAKRCVYEGSNLVPVYIQCRLFYEHENFSEAIHRQLRSLGFSATNDNFEPLAKSGRLCFAFDGVDEVPKERRQLFLEGLNKFVNDNKSCQFVVSSRHSTERILDYNFKTIEIDPFNDNQILEYSYHKLQNNNLWRDFIERVKEESSISEIIRNPLALGLVATRFMRGEHTPHLMTEVLEDVVDMLVDHWDSSRGIRRSTKDVLSPKITVKILGRIAEFLEDSKQTEFEKVEVTSLLEFIVDDEQSIDVLSTIHSNTSLLKHKESGKWHFSHKVFQEYFSAIFKVDRIYDEADLLVDDFDFQNNNNKKNRLRYFLGNSSDATQAVELILNLWAADPHKAHYIRSLNYAMSERISMSPLMASKYAKTVAIVAEQYLEKIDNIHFENFHRTSALFSMVGELSHEQDFLQIREFFHSLRTLRDGSLCNKVKRELNGTGHRPELAKLAVMIEISGTLHIRLETQCVFIVEIYREHPELGETN